MSLNLTHLRGALALALGAPPPSEAEAEALSDVLGVREEVLAHLVIRRGAFAASPRIRAALASAARKVAATRRDSGDTLVDPARLDAQDRDLTRRLRAVIELQSRESETLEGAERALRDRVLSSPPAAYDAHLRIRLPDQT